MANPSRHRATIDLRGTQERLQAFATARQLTLAGCVRRAVEAMLATDGTADEVAPGIADRSCDGPLVKVTLRLPAVHARLLAFRARKADVSQGGYVAGLIEGAPLAPRMPDHDEVVAALSRSTSCLAALCVDLNGAARTLQSGLLSDAGRICAVIDEIAEVVHEHVRLASQLIAGVQSTGRRPSIPRCKRVHSERKS